MWYLPQLSPAGISAPAAGPSGNGSSRRRRRQRRAPGPHALARQTRSLWTVGQATPGSCLHSPTARTRPQRLLGRPVGPQAGLGEGWREFEKFPEGPDFPAYLHPGRGLSLGVARELVQAEEVGGRPVRKRQNLIHIKSNTFCVHFR